MRVMTWNLKGGVGKTSLSLALAIENGWLVATNDYHSPLEHILPEKSFKKMTEKDTLPVPPEGKDVIYDFGGKADGRVLDAIAIADVIIVPVIYQAMQDMYATLATLRELRLEGDELAKKGNHRPIMEKVIVVINRAGKDTSKAEAAIRKVAPDITILPMKESNIFAKVISTKKPISALLHNPLLSYAYSGVKQQFDILDGKVKELGGK
ncbi:MAG: hypothetical protein PHQ35_10950 [Phycisphaerae bacterium]|nr:hypothetical protein [Phycisphaerae bacterium]